jgi:hypothetical protein
MDGESKLGAADNFMQTVCVGGLFIVDKQVGYDRRHNMHRCKKEYERRLRHWAKNFKRRRQFIDIII